MSVEFSATLDGATQFARALERFRLGISDFSPVWSEISKDFRLLEQELFSSEGSSSGSRWAPLAPSTLKAKGGRGSILVRTGELQSSLVKGGKGSIERVTPSQLTIGTSVGYARHHQYGTRRMPRRSPIILTEADKKRWVKLLQRHLVKLAREAGLLSYGGTT